MNDKLIDSCNICSEARSQGEGRFGIEIDLRELFRGVIRNTRRMAETDSARIYYSMESDIKRKQIR